MNTQEVKQNMSIQLYLTSSPAGQYREWGRQNYKGLNPLNDLAGELKKDWRGDAACLLIAASPDEYERNDAMAAGQARDFQDSGLPVSRFDVCDGRNGAEMAARLSEYDVLVLSGGHVPTENAFLHKIGLAERLRDFDGIVMGISAGTMNCAETVYAMPEEEGESRFTDAQRFIPGLGLTCCNVIPHFQAIQDDRVDGLRVIEDILLPDSMGREFYALPDGSYILQRDGAAVVHGEAYRIKDGEICQICRTGETKKL